MSSSSLPLWLMHRPPLFDGQYLRDGRVRTPVHRPRPESRCPDFETYLGCVSRRGPLAHHFPEAAQFPLGGSLFGWRSLRSRLNLSRYLRKHSIEVVHAFDFYANLVLIPPLSLRVCLSSLAAIGKSET